MSIARYDAKVYICDCGSRFIGYANRHGQDLDKGFEDWEAQHRDHGQQGVMRPWD